MLALEVRWANLTQFMPVLVLITPARYSLVQVTFCVTEPEA